MRVRLGWQDQVERRAKMADTNPRWMPGTWQALHKCMDGSFIYLMDICLAFSMCQVL